MLLPQHLPPDSERPTIQWLRLGVLTGILHEESVVGEGVGDIAMFLPQMALPDRHDALGDRDALAVAALLAQLEELRIEFRRIGKFRLRLSRQAGDPLQRLEIALRVRRLPMFGSL